LVQKIIRNDRIWQSALKKNLFSPTTEVLLRCAVRRLVKDEGNAMTEAFSSGTLERATAMSALLR
jgi:hypothetical protein